jgi:ubiquinol-cytochrome c reductase cytochrome b subunit
MSPLPIPRSRRPARRGDEQRQTPERQALDVLDDRLGSSRFLRSAMDKIFPDHWSFMVGEIAMYCFIILLISGIYLTFFFEPSQGTVVYHGVYKPLDGQTVTRAYASVINLSFQVRGGLVMRQIHHWAAIVFLAAIGFHMGRVFFTGAFRRPREINWIIGLTLMLVSLLNGYLGYSIPDDLLSGTGLRVVFSIIESIPLIGPWLAFSVWGGQYPGTSIIFRFFIIHVLLFPLVILGLLTAHLMILWHQKHTDFPGPGKTELNIKGSRLWPQYAFKSLGLFAIVTGVLGALGGLVQVNPVWLYGPYHPGSISEGSQPDWYVGWLDGGVRLWPHWELVIGGHEILANAFFPGILLPGIIFNIMYAWPWIERAVTKDRARHNLLDRPRDNPFRTAIGAGTLTFFIILTIASASDILANNLRIDFERIIEILQISVFVGPVAIGYVAYKVCKNLQLHDSHPIQKPVAGIIVRTVTGGYTHAHDDHDDHGGNGHGGFDGVDSHAANGHAADGHTGNGHGGAGDVEHEALTD